MADEQNQSKRKRKLPEKKVGEIGIIRLTGICDASRKDEISDFFEITMPKRPKPWFLAIDLKGGTFLDSTILGLILQWYKRIDSTGGVMAIFSANEKLNEIFRMTRIDKFVTVYKDWAECHAALLNSSSGTPVGNDGSSLRGEDRLKLKLESIRRTLAEGAPGDSAVKKLLSRLESCSRDIDLLDTMMNLYVDSLESLEKANKALSKELEKRRRLEKARIKALEMAHRANTLKNFFLATLGHEIKNSINCIIGFSKFLAKEFTAAGNDRTDACDYILESAQHIQSLVEEVSDIAAIEAGKIFIQHAPIELKSFISSLKHTAFEETSEKGLTIKTETGSGLDLLLSDQVRLRQIIANLLVNAVKFSPPGAKIGIKIIRAGNRVKFSISDQGPGIPKDQQKQIFEPFHQLKIMRSSRRGTGLGLTVVKNLTELLGGSIEVSEAEFGTGSVFTITIPGILESLSTLDEPAGDSTEETRAFSLSAYNSVNLKLQIGNPSCFVLSESNLVLRYLESILASSGARVASYRRENKIRRQLTAEKLPKTGVIDLTGQGMGPRKMISLILKQSPETRLIVIGASPDQQNDWLRQGQQGMAFLSKGYHPMELLSAVAGS